eukprot:jgi/Tetstr1/446326/TSEL_033869.t1
MLPRYNALWLDPNCEAVDSLHLSDAEWRRENDHYNSPWPLLPDLVQELRQSGAAATVVAPRWEGKVWHQALTEVAVAERVGVPPLGATAATVARYIAWQGLRGNVTAASLQPYLSAINGFYRDHSAEPVAQGDLISKFAAVISADCQQPRGAATAAYAIGVVLQKTNHFGSWAQLSSVVLDYINPTALPCVLVHKQKRAGSIIKHNINAVKNMAAMQAVPGDNVDEGSSPEPPAKKAKQPAKPAAGGPGWCRGQGGRTPLSHICYQGGWGTNSDVVLDYMIDPNVLPSPCAWFFFGHIAPLRHFQVQQDSAAVTFPMPPS